MACAFAGIVEFRIYVYIVSTFINLYVRAGMCVAMHDYINIP